MIPSLGLTFDKYLMSINKFTNMKLKMEAQSLSMMKCVKRVWKSVPNSPRSGVINSFSRRVAFPLIKLS